ncbi:MAG TPA: PA14 domain-containing protein [Archangium sp.]|uniref:PA14 domain-containing protein n=1 Tax=Archangium sp. TaxID=1872627 RepID=UPI002E318434|nr:PA14 domain-containing protein [Archangium sp.]HEX5752973.1 PA14 domain-containing protein [Archangium sp.]
MASLAMGLTLWGCDPADMEQGAGEGAVEEAGEVGRVQAALTAQELDEYAQRGLDFIVPDTVAWTQSNGCGACHRVGAPLYAGSLGAYTGYSVNTSTVNGTGYLANFLANEQLPAGYWTHGAGSHTFIKSAYNAFGLAGYTQFDSTVHQTKVEKVIDWAIGATAGTRFNNPMDGKPLQGVSSVYVPQDHGSDPVTYGWQMPTAYFALATRALLDSAPGLPPLQRDNYKTFLRGLADSVVGQYVRSNGGWRSAEVAFAAIGAIQDGRTPNTDVSVASMRDDLLNRYSGGGWGDTTNGSPNIYSTGVALYSLCLMDVRSDQNATVFNALNWLASQQCTSANNSCATGNASLNGSWKMTRPNGTTLGGDVPSTFATLAMACYGSLNMRVTLDPPSVTLAPLISSPQTTSFNVTVTNTGYTLNTYTLVPSGSWPGMVISHNNPSLTLAPGSSATDVVTVTLPANLPESLIIPVSVKVSYLTKSGMVDKAVTFNVFIPPQPDANGLSTTTSILSPVNGSVFAPGTSVNLAAKVKLDSTGNFLNVGSVTFYSGGAVIATVQADANGTFAYNWPVPASAPLGPQTFTATYNGYAKKDPNTNQFLINYKGSKADGTFSIGYSQGASCSTSAQCLSGFCVDGVCCDSACGGGDAADCQACSRLAGATADGTCGAAVAGTVCRSAKGVCDFEEVCNGSSTTCGTDVVRPSGTSCGLNSAACNTVGDCTVPPKGLNGRYYNNTTFTEPFALNRIDPSGVLTTPFSFNWGTGSPGVSVNADNFSVRWTGDVSTPSGINYTGRYEFTLASDDGVRLYVNGKRIIDNWNVPVSMISKGSIYLEQGKRYSIMLEYFEGTGSAQVQLQWTRPDGWTETLTRGMLTPAINSPVAVRIKSPMDRTSYLAPASVLVDVEALGLYASLDGIQLFQDGVSLGTKTAPPYRWPVSLASAGVYTFSARTTATVTTTAGTVALTQTSKPVAVRVLPSPAGTGVGQGLLADYFNGTNFNTFEFTRSEYTLFLDGAINNPLPQDILDPNAFSVRWTGTVIPAYAQAYTFSVQANHPARVWVKNTLVIDTQANPGQTASAPVGLSAGERVPVKVEYVKNSSTATLMKLFWESQSEPKSLVPGTRAYPATVSSQ